MREIGLILLDDDTIIATIDDDILIRIAIDNNLLTSNHDT